MKYLYSLLLATLCLTACGDNSEGQGSTNEMIVRDQGANDQGGDAHDGDLYDRPDFKGVGVPTFIAVPCDCFESGYRGEPCECLDFLLAEEATAFPYEVDFGIAPF